MSSPDSFGTILDNSLYFSRNGTGCPRANFKWLCSLHGERGQSHLKGTLLFLPWSQRHHDFTIGAEHFRPTLVQM